jgi:probable HAF family extracellular repeat protein
MHKTLALALALVAAAQMPRAQDRPLLIELPDGATPAAIGGRGSIVVGTLRSGGGFYWMPTSGVVYIGGTSATAVSRDGRTIVGNALDAAGNEQAAVWQRAAEWRLIGTFPGAQACDRLLTASYGANGDGKVIVGLGWNGCSFARAFRWSEATSVVDLGSSVAGRSSRANAVSADGRVVVGWQEHATGPRQGARWVDGDQELYVGPHGPVGEARAVNVDGSVVVGQTCSFADPTDQSAWVWTPTGVRCYPAPRVRPLQPFISMALATSDDGRVIGGAQSFGLESEAILWLDGEPIYLVDYLRSNGIANAFEGWVNTGFVTAVSPDGKVIAGYGAGPRDFKGYVVILGGRGRQTAAR